MVGGVYRTCASDSEADGLKLCALCVYLVANPPLTRDDGAYDPKLFVCAALTHRVGRRMSCNCFRYLVHVAVCVCKRSEVRSHDDGGACFPARFSKVFCHVC